MKKAVIIKERCYTVVIRDRVASERSRCGDSINECCSWTVERVIFQGATVAWLAFQRNKRWASTPRPFWVTFQHSPHDCVDSQVLCWQKRCKTSWKESIKKWVCTAKQELIRLFLTLAAWRRPVIRQISLAGALLHVRSLIHRIQRHANQDMTKTSMLNEDLLSLFIWGGVKTKESAHSVAVVL